MIDNDTVGLFVLLSSAYIAGVFMYVNWLLNQENRAKAGKLAETRAISDGMIAVLKRAAKRVVKCCRVYK